MTLQTLANIIIGLAVVGLVLYRQMSWRGFARSQLWRMPIAFGVIGVAMMAQTSGGRVVTSVDAIALAVELVISAGLGIAMGAMAVFRERTLPAGGAAPSARDERHAGRRDRNRPEIFRAADGSAITVESRTGWLGLGLWVLLIVIRLGIDFEAGHLGAVMVTATGVILLMVAANRAVRVLVLIQRVDRRWGTGGMIKA
ncbi:MAG: hypothetical protein ABI400_13285 [Lacisediminihabitans sp.]